MNDGDTMAGVPESEWKDRARADFEQWLLHQPDDGPAVDAGESGDSDDLSGDLLTVIGEVTALKQEVRGLGRNSARLTAGIEQAVERMGDDLHRAANDMAMAGREAVARGRIEAEKPVLLELGDIREALNEILARPQPKRPWRPWPRRSPRSGDAARETVAVLIRRLDAVLARYDVKSFGAPGEFFDGRRMTVTGVSQDGSTAGGTVSAVVRVGYDAGGTLLRPAEVIVEKERAS